MAIVRKSASKNKIARTFLFEIILFFLVGHRFIFYVITSNLIIYFNYNSSLISIKQQKTSVKCKK